MGVNKEQREAGETCPNGTNDANDPPPAVLGPALPKTAGHGLADGCRSVGVPLEHSDPAKSTRSE